MSLPSRKYVFGVHSIAAYNPQTGVPYYDIAKVIGNLTINFSGELVQLNGGSQPFPWAVENGVISTEGTLLLREYPDFVYEAFMGSTVTNNAAEAAGSVTTITNKNGTSLVAATGIASVGLKSGASADVKTAQFVVVAASATTVNVYALSDVDFKTGTDLSFIDGSLKINESPLTIATGTAVDIPNTGLELTGGAGTIAMTTGDTAMFDSRAINTGSRLIEIGDANFSLPDVGLICVAQKAGSSKISLIKLYRCKGAGVPLSFAEKAFSEAEIAIQAFYDETAGKVADILEVENVA